jgi:hypothetical protein
LSGSSSSRWRCTGTGSSDSEMIFLGIPADIQSALNGMTYINPTPRVIDMINITLFDGAGGNCLDNSQLGPGSIRVGCHTTSVSFQVRVLDYTGVDNTNAFAAGASASSATSFLSSLGFEFYIIVAAIGFVLILVCLRCCWLRRKGKSCCPTLCCSYCCGCHLCGKSSDGNKDSDEERGDSDDGGAHDSIDSDIDDTETKSCWLSCCGGKKSPPKGNSQHSASSTRGDTDTGPREESKEPEVSVTDETADDRGSQQKLTQKLQDRLPTLSKLLERKSKKQDAVASPSTSDKSPHMKDREEMRRPPNRQPDPRDLPQPYPSAPQPRYEGFWDIGLGHGDDETSQSVIDLDADDYPVSSTMRSQFNQRNSADGGERRSTSRTGRKYEKAPYRRPDINEDRKDCHSENEDDNEFLRFYRQQMELLRNNQSAGAPPAAPYHLQKRKEMNLPPPPQRTRSTDRSGRRYQNGAPAEHSTVSARTPPRPPPYNRSPPSRRGERVQREPEYNRTPLNNPPGAYQTRRDERSSPKKR